MTIGISLDTVASQKNKPDLKKEKNAGTVANIMYELTKMIEGKTFREIPIMKQAHLIVLFF